MGGERGPAAAAVESQPPAQRDPAVAPAAPPPAAPPPARSAESPAPGAGSDNKYVVWSSAPSDVQRSGPEDR
jgi:hypothetical protein